MRITFCCTDTAPDPWLAGLSAALPQARVSVWQPGDPVADYGLVWAPPQRFIDEQRGIRALFNIGAGVDALMRLRLPADLPVVRLEDAGMAVQMAEYVCQAAIRFFRGLPGYEADMARGVWHKQPNPRRADFPVGVMGLGRLGERVARALTVFDFPVNGWSRRPHAIDGVRNFCGDGGFDAFLSETRILVNLLPLTPATENIINARTLALLRPGAYIINVARGAHVVDADLLAAIANGHVGGALLDVFRTEPLPPEHAFWSEPRIALTPHTSARTLAHDSVAQIAAKVAAMSRGQALSGQVDLDHGY